MAEYRARVTDAVRCDDVRLLELRDLCSAAHIVGEKEPERAVALLTQARDLALQQRDPWWILFFENQRLYALLRWAEDYAHALPLAVELLVRFSSPEGRDHSDRLWAMQNILWVFEAMDPMGFRQDIESGLAYLDERLPRGPAQLRFVHNYLHLSFLRDIHEFDRMRELGLAALELIDRSQTPVWRQWHGAWARYQLCRACHALDRIDEVSTHARDMARRSEDYPGTLHRTLADAYIWEALVRRRQGDERGAAEVFSKGALILDTLLERDTVSADPMAAYYAACEDFMAAVAVRDRQLAMVQRHANTHEVCEVHVSRCELLARARRLTDSDLASARAALAKLRKPEFLLTKLDGLQVSSAGRPDGA